MHRAPATPSVERMEAELQALRVENARLRRRLAALKQHDDMPARPGGTSRERAADVRSMLRDRASRNP
ncbi:MAG TPA: hypothetical protein VFN87_12080 [Solirubrobacteraceae bacterium]|nr:hypothetical protein [Solirubrobacteraceae bacterium]